ncbi:DUF2470 domain-containing protein [Gordonia sp. HY285]|uniref:DUF2470 domain-containing protein n=1 Tax=Gordonia liuliyuniae TaxID=2911517 RepID=A0ABS9INY2_9ACTN|nr:DUF2470 domain-containing protein [Gordonia liuliyuniae]MCF8587280.1 DUF2470 domain-containing protein [Gordonia liuliyuniae]MCF8608852.1 DUF2470 domain-containing protein [Gordonia liuliyuniae]
MATIVAPCDAEMIQTACRRARGGTLSVDGAASADACDEISMIHLFEGDAFLLINDDAPALAVAGGDGERRCVVEVIDCAPLQLRERVRALVWLTGGLHEVPTDLQRELAVEIAGDHPDERLLDVGHGYSMVRMALETAVIATSIGAGAVAVDELACAEPDVFWAYENDWLAHLESDHADLVHQLALRIPAALRSGRVRPLRLDRFGLTFRVETADSDVDVRLPFSRPVGRVADLSAALHALALHPELDRQSSH